jgi:hypothetical protein
VLKVEITTILAWQEDGLSIYMTTGFELIQLSQQLMSIRISNYLEDDFSHPRSMLTAGPAQALGELGVA